MAAAAHGTGSNPSATTPSTGGAARAGSGGKGSTAEKAGKADRTAAPPLPEPLRVPVADSHTHLDMQSGTVEEALAKAAAVGVTTVVQVGCDLPGSRWAAETAAAHDAVWATVALHPNEAPRIVHGVDGASGPSGGAAPQAPRLGRTPLDPLPPGGDAALEEALAEIDRLAALPQVRGVGETGLDFFRTGPEGIAAQEYSFRRHIDIAKRHGKALVIHDRDAHDDVLRVLDEEGAPDTVVFHCFSGDADMAKTCADKGYLMSFAGNVTFKSAQPLRDALAVAPRELLLVETDAPFLTPAPYRGRPNAPYLIPVTLRAMAAVKGVDEDALAAAISANTARAFGY
ncbi:TatD family hydrolase [Streptomyces sp. URMC 123]|uniref:TatD family hydrolase n=1 Tax=Streptomyces sp. URMC 123 TaxID=3423403 RepID=UPI003F1B07F2